MTSLSATGERAARPAVPRALRSAAPGLLAAVLAVAYLLWEPTSIDMAASEYRVWLFGREGLSLYDLGWYGGHHMPAYSVLLPPLGHLLGLRLLGALCAVAAAVLFAALARGRFGDRALLGALWFAAGSATLLLSGRVTFALGLAPALGALLALQASDGERAPHGGGSAPRGETAGAPAAADASARPRGARVALRALAATLAVLAALASPVAAVFLAMGATAWALAAPWPAPRSARSLLRDRRRALGLGVAAAAVAPVGALSLAFPEGGTEPFVVSAFWPVLAVSAAALWLFPREERTLRAAVVLYALGCTAAFLLDTPVGGNAARLGALCAGPVFALALWPRRRTALAAMALPLLFWQWTAAYHDVRAANGKASTTAAFFAPLNGFLDRAQARGEAGRVEIPFTRLHWEARHVAPRHELARGWMRQLDHKVNDLFYGDAPLTADRYRAWLDEMAVRWVALPDAELDYSAEDEAELIRDGLPYLREAWRGGAWTVYEVEDPAPLASAPARIVALGADEVVLDVPRPATVDLRMHWTPYWRVARGDACVERNGEQTRLRVRAAGEVRLVTSFSLGRVGARGPRCSG